MLPALPIGAALAALALALAAQAEPAGRKPSYLASGPSPVPNAQAIDRELWAPGLDEGYVPQGVAFEDGHVYVSAYRSTDPKVSRGPCRVFRMDAATGAAAGAFDLPGDCGHAGGLAHVASGTLLVGDTRQLYRIDTARALASGRAEDGLTASVRLAGDLKASFVAFNGTDLWVGAHEKDPARARLQRLPLAVLDEANGRTITEERATARLPIPVDAQGAAFGKDGVLWVAASSSRHGTLYRLDRRDGAVLAQHALVIGVEDLEFDGDGRLWTVSEAGSQRWLQWSATYPVVFRLDPGRLR